MEYRAFASMNIAIIGGGEVSRNFAAEFAVRGHSVLLSEKGDDPVLDRALLSLPEISYTTIEMAATLSDFIIITAAAQHVREIAYWLGDVRRKVIIDISHSNAPGRPDYLNTVRAINAIAGSNDIVKAVSTLGYEKLFRPLFGHQKAELLLAGDSLKAKEISKIVMKEAGLRSFYDFGSSDTFHLLDETSQCIASLIAMQKSRPVGLLAV